MSSLGKSSSHYPKCLAHTMYRASHRACRSHVLHLGLWNSSATVIRDEIRHVQALGSFSSSSRSGGGRWSCTEGSEATGSFLVQYNGFLGRNKGVAGRTACAAGEELSSCGAGLYRCLVSFFCPSSGLHYRPVSSCFLFFPGFSFFPCLPPPSAQQVRCATRALRLVH